MTYIPRVEKIVGDPRDGLEQIQFLDEITNVNRPIYEEIDAEDFIVWEEEVK